ncbi:hypothetical protein EM868_03585 [Cupriavidus gilardii]|uniref:hypothetical protein n=1 Tax=Cupriavidus gilardii TaxID=82541 RepID=UPI00157364E4|nr:hypothetical protein [Cupriavidus gilardii]MCG5260901.1 hypothetical protein [Cupriavidus gilardii]MDF9428884.1 hypothetical protein [Cupriavidus gilardii]NSX02245.1 hypothetical protein [Cupriavidus gilardii]
MNSMARRALCCALAVAAAGGAHAIVPSAYAQASQVLYPSAEQANVCEGDSQALQQAINRHLQPNTNAIDQWTQLVRSMSCDLSGSKDLGWRRVPLRAYESAIRYPLTWVETVHRNGRQRRLVRTYHSASQLPPRIDFWIGGRIDEIRYDRRHHRLYARFSATSEKLAGNAPSACRSTTLQFRQQHGLWLLSGVEPRC